jgi:Fe-S oxidoreductase
MPLSRDADYATYLYTCNRCRACTTVRDRPELMVCPSFAAAGFFAFSGGGRGYMAQGVLEGRVPPSPEAAEVALHCTLCHACQTMCPPGFETTHFIRDLRAWLVRHGVYANPAHRRILENMRKFGNPGGASRSVPVGATGQSPLCTESHGAEALLFLGCRFEAGATANLQKLIRAAGAKLAILPDEPCCGNPALELGDQELFARMARKNLERLNAAGVERIITWCPHCTSTLIADYQEIGELQPEVIHLSEWIAELLEQGRIGLADTGAELSVTFHDPCHLTRYLERGESARQALARVPGLELREMERSGESAYCCGGGSFVPQIMPELWRATARERMAEALATGAKQVVTACPYCQASLSQVAAKKIGVVMLLDLIAGHLA